MRMANPSHPRGMTNPCPACRAARGRNVNLKFWRISMPPVIDPEKCIGCGTCAQICPDEVFGLEHGKGEIPVVRYPDECWHCNACVRSCPAGALSLRIPVNFHIMHQSRSHCND